MNQTVLKWKEDSKLEDIMREEYPKNGIPMEDMDIDLQRLKNDRRYVLKSWRKLDDEEKKKYPPGLVDILDVAAGQGIFLKNSYFLGTKKREGEELEHIVKKPTLLPWQQEGSRIDSNDWEKDLEMTEYANELLSATEEHLSNGVQRIALTRWLQSNEKGSTNLFTRKCQRELWDEVFKYLDSTDDSHAIITGNPGVGKSRSMVYFLRFLLQNNKTFIFESRKDEIVYAFIPPNGHEDGSTNYMVWSCESRKFSHMNCLILKNPHNYYLIDMTKDSIKITEVVAHIVLSASPRIFSRIKDFTGRTDPPLQFIMPVWKREELDTIRPYFPVAQKVLNEDDFQNRFLCFDGRPRYVFTSHPEYVSRQIKGSVDELTFQQLKWVAENPLIEPNINVETGPSMIFAYVEKETNIHSKYRYEMKKLNYTVTIASETILLQILYKYWQELKDFLSPTDLYYQSNPLLCGHIFEAVGKIFIQFGGTFDVYSCPSGQEPLGRLELKQKSELLSKGNSWWDYFVECSKLPSSDTVRTRKALIPNASNQPFIDMMDACKNPLQLIKFPLFFCYPSCYPSKP
jgi:hypothetical protein